MLEGGSHACAIAICREQDGVTRVKQWLVSSNDAAVKGITAKTGHR